MHQLDSGDRVSRGLFESLLVVPRHPALRSFSDELRISCQRRQVGKGIDLVQFTGMDEAHKQVPDRCSCMGFIKQGTFPEEHEPLDHLFAN